MVARQAMPQLAQWAWADTGALKPMWWSAQRSVLDVLSDLDSQRLLARRRPVAVRLSSRNFDFADAEAAAAFLRPMVPPLTARRPSIGKPVWLTNAFGESLCELEESAPEAFATSFASAKLDASLGVCATSIGPPCGPLACGVPAVAGLANAFGERMGEPVWTARRALCCSLGHPVQCRSSGAVGGEECSACGDELGPHDDGWHCPLGCDYTVCDTCHQRAVVSASSTDVMGFHSSLLPVCKTLSEASTEMCFVSDAHSTTDAASVCTEEVDHAAIAAAVAAHVGRHAAGVVVGSGAPQDSEAPVQHRAWLAAENVSLRARVRELEAQLTQVAEQQAAASVEQSRITNAEVEQVAAVEHSAAASDAPAVAAVDAGKVLAAAAAAASGEAAAATPADTVAPKGKGKGKTKGKGKGEAHAATVAAESAASEADAAAPVPADAAARETGKGKGKDGKGAAKGGSKGAPAPKAAAKGAIKGAVVEFTKPDVALHCDMKSLNWTRFNNSQLQEGKASIWHRVGEVYEREEVHGMVPTEELETRFSKTAGLRPVERDPESAAGPRKHKAATLKSIQPDTRLAMEVALRMLPAHLANPASAAEVLQNLDSEAMSVEAAEALLKWVAPSQEQALELRAVRQEGEREYERCLEEWEVAETPKGPKPVPFRWNSVEAYMERLAQLPASKCRLSCWVFLRKFPEEVEFLTRGFDLFERMVACFRDSQELPFLLSLVLAFGNCLNSGKNQKRLGRADGFHIEALSRPGGLDVVNDPAGQNIRHLIFKEYFGCFPGRSAALLEELAPLFQLVQRRLRKKEGVPMLSKDVRVQIEELDKRLGQLSAEFLTAHQEFCEALHGAEGIHMPGMAQMFERGRRSLDDLASRKDRVGQQFKDLLSVFRAETYRGDAKVVNGTLRDGNPREEMTSAVWCQLWDDFFVPKDLYEKHNEKIQRLILEPRFCKDDVSPNVDGLVQLWRLPELQASRAIAASAARRLGGAAGATSGRRSRSAATEEEGPPEAPMQGP